MAGIAELNCIIYGFQYGNSKPLLVSKISSSNEAKKAKLRTSPTVQGVFRLLILWHFHTPF